MSQPESPGDTYIACLTPAGAAAIACLALWGPRAWDLVRELFRPRSPSHSPLPAQPETGRLWLGLLGDGVGDEVVITVKSTRPVMLVEVHCHGGREVIRLLRESFESRGVRGCSWQEFESRVTGDAVHAAATAGLAKALTVRTASILLDQYQGALTQAMQRLFAHWNQDEEEEAGKILAELHGWAGVGRHLTVPWRVVIAGAPNVGKSSIINALAGYQRSIVTEIPGTTRDVVTALIAVDGWPVELADTAGMRKQADDLEQAGMELAQRAAIEADLCLWVLDATCEPTWPDIRVNQLRFVVNKIDLPAAWDTSQASGAIRVSARTEEGLLELCQAISQALVPESPAPGMAIPFTFELCAAVEQALPLQRAGKSNEARQVLKSAWTAVSPDKLMPAG